jgi:predicted PurR-regulated permease PerM
MITDSQKWFVLALVVLNGWLVYLLAPVLTPFLVAALLSYLGDPLVDRCEALGVSRTGSVLIVFLGMVLFGIAGVLVVLPALQAQIAALVRNIPAAIDWLQQWLLPKLSTFLATEDFPIDVAGIRETLTNHWQQVGSLAKNLMGHISRSGQLVVGWLTYLLLIPVVTFYLLRDWDILVANIHDLLPRKIEPRVVALSREIDAVLAEFLRGQLTVMAALGTIYVTGLWLVVHWLGGFGAALRLDNPIAQLALVKIGLFTAVFCLVGYTHHRLLQRLEPRDLRAFAAYAWLTAALSVALLVVGVGIRTGGLW